MRNRIGTLFSLTSFGESHGPAIGGVIDGMPAGVQIDFAKIQQQLDRRRPAQNDITSTRREDDRLEILSGVMNGITLGTPIGFIIRNHDQREGDYDHLSDCYRPNHADYTYEAKYGIRDHRGGGRASARETAVRVVAGAFAMQALERLGIKITAYTTRIGEVALNATDALDLSAIDNNAVRCPNTSAASRMEDAIRQAKAAGDTLGGIVRCTVDGVPAGLGEPVFGKLTATLAQAMMSIPAAKGIEFGDGFNIATRCGSEVIDEFAFVNGKITTTTNHSGGIQGGISNGAQIVMNVAFKPVATLMRATSTVNRKGEAVTLPSRGRHDACVIPRAIPVVEAMAAITILDNYLLHKSVTL